MIKQIIDTINENIKSLNTIPEYREYLIDYLNNLESNRKIYTFHIEEITNNDIYFILKLTPYDSNEVHISIDKGDETEQDVLVPVTIIDYITSR